MTRPRSDERDGVASATQRFDVVIRSGGVLDPALSVDTVADVGIRGDRIVAVGADLDTGQAAVVDATRRLVCPGLVDLHVHGFEWATVIGMADGLGTLAPGTRADITILEELEGEWVFVDSSDDRLTTHRRLVPTTIVRAGPTITPTRRLLRDVLPNAERGEPVDAPSGSE